MISWPNQITAPKAGGPRQFPIRTLLTASVGEFYRSTTKRAADDHDVSTRGNKEARAGTDLGCVGSMPIAFFAASSLFIFQQRRREGAKKTESFAVIGAARARELPPHFDSERRETESWGQNDSDKQDSVMPLANFDLFRLRVCARLPCWRWSTASEPGVDDDDTNAEKHGHVPVSSRSSSVRSSSAVILASFGENNVFAQARAHV
jgi:hypothetical protein